MPAPTLSLCRLGDEPAVRVLLELGADPSAGRTSEALRQAGRSHLIAELLLQHGADCLLPAARQRGTHTSLLADFASQPGMHSGAALMLAHLERQRSAGQLQLGSAARAAQLLLASTRRGHQQLFSHSLRCLEKHFTEAEDTAAAPAAAAAAAAAAPAAVAAALTPNDADAILREILAAAIGDASSSSLDRVQALLASSLPLDLTLPDDLGRSVLASAALSASSCAAKVRLLHQAGAPPTTLCDLLIAVDGLSAPGVEALLEAGAPPVDASQVSLRVQHVTSYSCPIHRTLHTLVRCCQHWALRCTALHCTALHCTALHCTGLCCTVLHCSIVCSAPRTRAAQLGQSTWQRTCHASRALLLPPCHCRGSCFAARRQSLQTSPHPCGWWRHCWRQATSPQCTATRRPPPFCSAAARCWRCLIPSTSTGTS